MIELRAWYPKDLNERPRLVTVEQTVFHRGQLLGVVVREIDRPLAGVAFIHLNDLGELV